MKLNSMKTMFKSFMFLLLSFIGVGLTITYNLLPEEFSRVYYSYGGDTLLYALLSAVGVAITFSEVPSNARVPWMYIEFDNSGAIKSSPTMPHKLAIVGQKLGTGTAADNTPVLVTSYAQAKTLFGAGSMLAFMADKVFKNNKFTEAWFFPLPEIVGGTQATGKITVTVTTVKAGTIALMIAGKRIAVAITEGMTDAQIATAIVAAITAEASDLPVTAAVNGVNDYEVDLTCNWKGSTGNYIDLRDSYYFGESLPDGVSLAYTAMASGATDPDVQDALDLFQEVHYTEIASAYTDSSNLTAMANELSTRNGATIQLDGYAYHGATNTLANLSTLGNSKNSQFLTIIGNYKSPSPPWEWAAALAAKCAFEATNDPARPLQTVELVGILPPENADLFNQSERNILLFDGISTFTKDANGSTRIERIITTYKTNPQGADDPSYLNQETLATLSFLRWDFRNTFLRKYPRFKLADDGNRYSPGQDILTPKNAKAEAIAIFLGWQERGLVENIDQFKESLIVERNISDRDRLDFLLEPDLINQFRVGGVKISFIL